MRYIAMKIQLPKSFRQVFAVTKISVRTNLAYPGEVLGRTVFLFVILYIFLKLWQATGVNAAEMLWYVAFTESIYMSAPRLAQLVDEDVRSGSISLRLLKPMSYPLYCLSNNLGERLVRFIFNLAISSLIAYVLVGPLHLSINSLWMAPVALLGAFILDGIGHLLVGLAAFWLEDTSGIFLIYTRLMMILGGMLLPLELFPDWLKKIVIFLPFPYLIYGPAHLFTNASFSAFWQVMAGLAGNILIFSLLAAFVYRIALRRISSHGG